MQRRFSAHSRRLVVAAEPWQPAWPYFRLQIFFKSSFIPIGPRYTLLRALLLLGLRFEATVRSSVDLFSIVDFLHSCPDFGPGFLRQLAASCVTFRIATAGARQEIVKWPIELGRSHMRWITELGCGAWQFPTR